MKWLAWPLAMLLAISGTSSGLEVPGSSEHPSVQTAEQKKAAQVKAEVARRGVGEKSRVRVKLRNKLEFKGHITQIEEDRFQLQIDPDWLDADTSKDRLVEVHYAEIEKIRGPRSRAANIGVGVGLTVALVAVVAAILVLKYDKYRRSQ